MTYRHVLAFLLLFSPFLGCVDPINDLYSFDFERRSSLTIPNGPAESLDTTILLTFADTLQEFSKRGTALTKIEEAYLTRFALSASTSLAGLDSLTVTAVDDTLPRTILIQAGGFGNASEAVLSPVDSNIARFFRNAPFGLEVRLRFGTRPAAPLELTVTKRFYFVTTPL